MGIADGRVWFHLQMGRFAVDYAGGDAPKQQAVRCPHPWGRIALVTVGETLNVDGIEDVIGKQRIIIGSCTFSGVSTKNCFYFVADHGAEVDTLLTDRWKLEQAEETYRMFDGQARR
ncbi:hypothetical protein PQR70_19540 [Paraburkholderia madseniana]|uniref:hypothetical protein n=1 Tax=Paraburkholderia madseniana TaxID=2599607 RepID=UPI0038B96B22